MIDVLYKKLNYDKENKGINNIRCSH